MTWTLLFWLQDLTMETELEAVNGRKVRAIEVFAHALRFFREHALKVRPRDVGAVWRHQPRPRDDSKFRLQEVKDQSSSMLEGEEIRWVITVPAVWRQPAKQFMREAAYMVGLLLPQTHLLRLQVRPGRSLNVKKIIASVWEGELHSIPETNCRLSVHAVCTKNTCFAECIIEKMFKTKFDSLIHVWVPATQSAPHSPGLIHKKSCALSHTHTHLTVAPGLRLSGRVHFLMMMMSLGANNKGDRQTNTGSGEQTPALQTHTHTRCNTHTQHYSQHISLI